MLRSDAVKLVETIGRRWWREYKAVVMWHSPGVYKVIVTHKATNRQFDVFDPAWEPQRGKVPA